jgi:hypothetical protein
MIGRLIHSRPIGCGTRGIDIQKRTSRDAMLAVDRARFTPVQVASVTNESDQENHRLSPNSTAPLWSRVKSSARSSCAAMASSIVKDAPGTRAGCAARRAGKEDVRNGSKTKQFLSRDREGANVAEAMYLAAPLRSRLRNHPLADARDSSLKFSRSTRELLAGRP